MSCPRPHALHARDDLRPDRLGRRLWVNQLSPAIVVTSEALDPAVAFHAIEKAEHLGLPVRNAGWREFFVNRPLIFVRRGHDPKPDAILEVVFKHGNGFRTNGKRPNDFRILDMPLPECKVRRTGETITSSIPPTYTHEPDKLLAPDTSSASSGE